MSFDLSKYPPEVISEIVSVLEWLEANRRGKWTEMGNLKECYDRWRDIIRGDPDLTDNCGTYKTVPGLSSYGRIVLTVHRRGNNSETNGKASKNPYRKKNVNGRMLEKLQNDQACRGWTSTQWAQFLSCSRPSVTATDTWKQLEQIRQTLKAERARDRSGRNIGRKNNDFGRN